MAGKESARAERLAKALRLNLARRKAKPRKRREEAEPAEPPESAEEGGDPGDSD